MMYTPDRNPANVPELLWVFGERSTPAWNKNFLSESELAEAARLFPESKFRNSRNFSR